MPNDAYLFSLGPDEWGCSACGDVKSIDTLDSGHRFPNFCDECGVGFTESPHFDRRAKVGWFYDPALRRMVRPSAADIRKRTDAGTCGECGAPIDPIPGGSSPQLRRCPVCETYNRGFKKR